jgi:hypothetical protein
MIILIDKNHLKNSISLHNEKLSASLEQKGALLVLIKRCTHTYTNRKRLIPNSNF